MDELQWADLVLEDISAPTTQNNEQNMMRWMTAEEPTDNWFDDNNPLNTSWGHPGSQGLNTYPDLTQGAIATADTLDQNWYVAVVQALRANAPTLDFAEAVEASPWAGGRYRTDPIQDITPPDGSVQAPSGISGSGQVGGTTGSSAASTTSSSSGSSSSGSSSGGGGGGFLGLDDLNPEHWAQDFEKAGLYITLVAVSLLVIGAGVWRIASPTAEKAANTAGSVAGTAAMVA